MPFNTPRFRTCCFSWKKFIVKNIQKKLSHPMFSNCRFFLQINVAFIWNIYLKLICYINLSLLNLGWHIYLGNSLFQYHMWCYFLSYTCTSIYVYIFHFTAFRQLINMTRLNARTGFYFIALTLVTAGKLAFRTLRNNSQYMCDAHCMYD